jgi:hypothetical protein
MSDASIAHFNGRYVVFNGYTPQGRRKDIFATYNRQAAFVELKRRLKGAPAVVRSPGRE